MAGVNERVQRALSAEDERTYTSRMAQALRLDLAQEEQVFQARLDDNTRRELVRSGIESLSRSDRRRLWAMQWKTGKDEIGSYEPFLLNRCRRHVREAHESLSDFDGKFLSGQSIHLFIELYEAATGVRALFDELWASSHRFMTAVSDSLVHPDSGMKFELSQFMSQREMQNIYLKERNKEQIRDMIIRRIDEYLSGVESERFEKLRLGLLPLYFLKPIAQFPFDRLFEFYGVEGNPRSASSFDRFDLLYGTEHLEKLYYAVYMARKMPPGAYVDVRLIRNAFPEYDEMDIERVNSSITWLADTAEEFAKKVPLADIIRVGRQDPFYRLQLYLPKIDVRAFYRAALLRKVLLELDKRFADIRMGVIGYLIRELFPKGLENLQNYGSRDNSPEMRAGLPRVKYGMAIQALVTFLETDYRRDLQQTVRVLTRILPARYREEQESLMYHASQFEDVVERFMAIDEGMGEEENDGQTLTRLRRNITFDRSQQNAYRAFVDQRHQEILGLLHKSLEHVRGIMSVFHSVIDLNSANVEESYRAYRGSRTTLRESLKQQNNRLDYLKALIIEAIALDDGY